LLFTSSFSSFSILGLGIPGFYRTVHDWSAGLARRFGRNGILGKGKKLGKKRTGTGNIFTMMGMKNYVENGHDYSPGLRSAVNMRRIAVMIC
jgi:hypothetical protein